MTSASPLRLAGAGGADLPGERSVCLVLFDCIILFAIAQRFAISQPRFLLRLCRLG